MTTIAYRDGIMAADTKITDDGIQWAEMTCIRKINDLLVGASGNIDIVEWFLRTWNRDSVNNLNIDHPIARLEGSKDQEFEALVAAPGTLYYLTPKLIATKIDCKYAAIGSGQNIALGAMWMGATAEKAIDAAMAHDQMTGGKVISISLPGVKVKK